MEFSVDEDNIIPDTPGPAFTASMVSPETIAGRVTKRQRSNKLEIRQIINSRKNRQKRREEQQRHMSNVLAKLNKRKPVHKGFTSDDSDSQSTVAPMKKIKYDSDSDSDLPEVNISKSTNAKGKSSEKVTSSCNNTPHTWTDKPMHMVFTSDESDDEPTGVLKTKKNQHDNDSDLDDDLPVVRLSKQTNSHSKGIGKGKSSSRNERGRPTVTHAASTSADVESDGANSLSEMVPRLDINRSDDDSHVLVPSAASSSAVSSTGGASSHYPDIDMNVSDDDDDDDDDDVVLVDDTPGGSTSNPAEGSDDSFVRHITQLEDDELMARRLQEELDQEYARHLMHAPATPVAGRSGSGSSGARNFYRGQSRSPVSVALSRSPMRRRSGRNSRMAGSSLGVTDLDRDTNMLQRIGDLPEYDWLVYEAVLAGREVPQPPPGQPHRPTNEVIDEEILRFLRERRERQRQPNPPHEENMDLPTMFHIPAPRRPNRSSRRQLHAHLHLSTLDAVANHLQGNRVRGRHPDHARHAPFMRDIGNDYEHLLALAEQLGEVKKRGLRQEQINQLPTMTFTGQSSDACMECTVCMCEYETGDTLRMLPCFHRFHIQCIDPWIKDNPSCPVCRVEVKLTQHV